MPKERTLDLPYPFDRVWDAASLVFQRARWNVTRTDRASGQFEVKVVMDLLTGAETFYVDLTRIDNNSTRVRVAPYPGRSLTELFDWGITGQYIDSFLSGLESALEGTLKP